MAEYKFTIDSEKLAKEASLQLEKKIKDGYQKTIDYFLVELFSEESIFRKKGIARQLIETQCLELLQNEEQTKTIIKKYAEENWERILQEATERALRHKANGLAFKNI